MVAEWRYDSRTEGRQLTDVEYSRRLRDWLNTLKLRASESPHWARWALIPARSSFRFPEGHQQNAARLPLERVIVLINRSPARPVPSYLLSPVAAR